MHDELDALALNRLTNPGTCPLQATYILSTAESQSRAPKGCGRMRLPLLILHILGGTIGLLSGTFAIAVRKGSRLHRASGNVFTVAMLTLASSAFCLAIMKSQHGNIVGSIITFYMIATAWLAGRRRGIGRLDLAAFFLGAGGAAAVITLGV